MSWNPRFVADLAADPLYPLFLLEGQVVGAFAPTTAPLMLSSFAVDGYQNCLVREGSSIQHPTLEPGTWARTVGAMTLGITPNVDIRTTVARGQVVKFLVGFPGYDVSEFECVWLGSVRNLFFRDGLWQLSMTELAGALQNRFSSDTNEQNLFFDLPASTKLDGDYDPAIDTTVTVDAVTGWDPNNNGDYVLRITPTDSPVYYVFASSLAALTFSGAAADVFDSPLTDHDPPTVGTAAIATDRDPVEAIAWIEAHPLDLVRKVLQSTGFATNGPDDDLPRSWSYGIPRDLVDRVDVQTFIDFTTTEHWDVLVDHSQADAQSWLTEVLRPAGLFVSTHQGCLTARAVISYTGRTTPGTVTISDDDLIEISEYQTWDDSSPVEYKTERVYAYNEADVSTFTEDHIATRPTRARRRRDLPWCFNSEGSSAAWTAEVANRLGPYDTRVPERIRVSVCGWRAAVASLGDIVFLTTAFLVPRTSLHGGHDPFEGTPCLLVGGGIDWFSGGGSLELLHVPQYEGVE